MNIDEAMLAHTVWKMKLQGYIRSPDQSLSPEFIERDDQCDLGKWIYSGEAGDLDNDVRLQELRRVHAEFHRAAADIVRRADLHEEVMSETSLAAGSPFARATRSVVRSLLELQDKAA